MIVVNWNGCRSRPVDQLERLLAHEAGHVLLNRRGEVVSGRQRLAATEPDWWLLCIGGLAAEEYRVELAVCNRGYGPAECVDHDHLIEVLYHLTEGVIDAVAGPSSQTPESMRNSVLRASDITTKVLAHAAAATVASGYVLAANQLGPFGGPDWMDYLEPLWQARLDAYARLPAADQPCDDADWDLQLRILLELERAQLEVFGFSYLGLPSGDQFLRTGSNDLFTERLSRYTAQVNAET